MGDKTKGTKKEGKKAKKIPFPQKITEFDQYLFGQGTHYDIYTKLGAHVTQKDGEKGVYFAVWAPNASRVCPGANLQPSFE